MSVSFALAPFYFGEDLAVPPLCTAVAMCLVCGLLNAAFQHMGSHCYVLHTLVTLMIVILIFIGICTMLMKIRALSCSCVHFGAAKSVQPPGDTNQSDPPSLDDDMAGRIEKAIAFRKALSDALADGTYQSKYGEPSVSSESLQHAEEEDLSDDSFGDWDEQFEMAAFMEDGLSRLVAQQDVSDDLSAPMHSALTPTSSEVMNVTYDIARRDSSPSPPQEVTLWTSRKVKMNRASRLRIQNGRTASNGNRKSGGGSPGGGERILLLW